MGGDNFLCSVRNCAEDVLPTGLARGLSRLNCKHMRPDGKTPTYPYSRYLICPVNDMATIYTN